MDTKQPEALRLAGMYPQLPRATMFATVLDGGFAIGNIGVYTPDQMRAYADATCAVRAATTASAPVVLPEPVAAQSRFADTPSDTWDSCSVEHARSFGGVGYEVRYLYTEQQVRAMLATATGLPAQAARTWRGGNMTVADLVMGRVPPGWQAVLVEPTKEMKVAAVKFANGPAVYKAVATAALEIEEEICAEAYEAMLAAAPQPPAPSGPALEPVDKSPNLQCQAVDKSPETQGCGPAREPLTPEQLVTCMQLAGFTTWDSRMWELKRQIEAALGITAAQKGDAHGQQT